ncbi:unnamed protein product [Adineta steineri]|uniref:EF-hand domain-containing protein n=1 Tax=Adineta steineri TaxID=433720 RepID=A0A813Z092_9BILA|nr:unnamed protein product [Adineta steineri]CAF1384837.1 unnamed protein product [Adineta steineri]
MEDHDQEQQKTEIIQSRDLETIKNEQSSVKSLIESILLESTKQVDNKKAQYNKKIKTSRQKELEYLTNVTKPILTSPEQLNIACERINSLLLNHKTILLPACYSLDKLNSGRVTYEQFRLVIRDLLPQMSKEDFFILTKLFEIENSVDYRMIFGENFSDGILQFITPISVLQPDEMILENKLSKSFDKTLQLNHSKYVTIYFRLITFDSYNAYPGHIKLTVSDQTSIYVLSKMIIEETQLATRFVSIFREKVCSHNTLLKPMYSLEYYDYTGTYDKIFPVYTLYYDYSSMDIYDTCPILKCDYYMK